MAPSRSRIRWNRPLVLLVGVLAQACHTPPPSTVFDDPEEAPPPSLLGSLAKRHEPRRPPRVDGGNAMSPSRGQPGSQTNPLPKLSQNMDTSFSKVENNVWRTSLSAQQAYQAVSRVIAQNYIIAQTDRSQLTISTEWDKFFIDGRLFRNRVNASVFPVSSRATEIVIRNSVEYYAADNKSSDIREANWFPTPDITDEVARIVEGLSRYTNNLARTQTQSPR